MTTELEAFETKYLHPLRVHGYFVQIARSTGPADTYDVDCAMYITDRDELAATSVLRYDPSESTRDDENQCIGCCCPATAPREFKRGAIKCPVCNEWTKPWAMRRICLRGTFQAVPDAPAVHVKGGKIPSDMDEMLSQHMIHCISNALTDLYVKFGSTMGGGGI